MPRGTVTANGFSPSGKPQVTIDGQKYSSSRCVPSTVGLQVGDKVEFDSNSSVFNGKTVWFINTYKLLSGATKYPHSQPTGVPQSAPVAPAAAPQKLSAEAPVADAERPAISNWIACAITAGFIAKPEQIGEWVQAAKRALRQDFGSDREIP